MTTLHDFEAQTIDGKPCKLSQYKDKVVLVVNVASKCGLTPHYKGLQELYEAYGDRGLVVLGFPCNQFKGQEPGTEAQIQSFCSLEYGVTFPMFSKIDVNGKGRHPLYAWLATQPTQPEGPGDIAWNFGKFLIGKQGQILKRFAPTVEPKDPALVSALEAAF